MAGNGGVAAILLGEFDEVVRMEEEVESVNAPMAVGIHGYASMVYALRGQVPEARQRSDLVERTMAGTSSSQDLATLFYQRAMMAFAEGRIDDALVLARQSRESYYGSDAPLGAAMAIHIGALRADLDSLRADRPYFVQNFILGAWAANSLRNADAALAALEGRVDDARTAYRQLVKEWRATGCRWDHALTLLEWARLLPPDDETRAARAEAEQLLAEMGATAFLHKLDAALPPVDATTGPDASAAPVPTSPKTAAAATR